MTNQSVFYTILASRVHDMKNSLGMLMNSLEEMANDSQDHKSEQYAHLQYQASRVNNDLMQVLSLYKIDNDYYPLAIYEHDVGEFLEDQYLQYAELAKHQGVSIELTCEDELLWYFDEHLISGVIYDVLGNATRYTQDKIILSGDKQDDKLVLSIEDNGPGFPQSLLETASRPVNTDFSSGSTGLGLYFCSVVAGLHINKKCQGRIQLDNASSLGGGRFRIILP